MHFKNNELLMEIIKKLPEELRRHILTFTYEFQPFVLLNDIRDYTRTRPILQEWYINRFAWEYPNAENDWLNNDLIGFCNEDQALMRGYKEKYYEIFRRLFLLKNKSHKQILHCCGLYRYSAKTNNTIWGIFTEEERAKFMKYYNI
jgi:hypothetical protein